jgi:ATP-dependent DNA helicase PIF1
LPKYFKYGQNTVASLIDVIYPNVERPNLSRQYFLERTILSSKNEDVDNLNSAVLEKIAGQGHLFHSADYIPTSEQSGKEDSMLNYLVEYLNKINCSRLLLVKLKLKAECLIIILRNLDVAHRVCNGSREMLTRYRNRVLEVELITRSHAGHKVFISRISNQPTENQIPFKFTRRQFPMWLCFSITINKSQG